MKHTILYLLCSLISVSGVFAQTRLYVRGSAVPGGIQQLTKFPTNVSGRNTFKFHGKLLPGNLYITTTNSETPSTYYAPKLVDTDIVTDKADYVQKRDSVGSEWVVLFEADNYRFTVDTYNNNSRANCLSVGTKLGFAAVVSKMSRAKASPVRKDIGNSLQASRWNRIGKIPTSSSGRAT